MKRNKAFTLIELLITIAIFGIIATLAIPSYQDYIRKQHRQVAKNELIRLAQSQIKWRVTHATYASVKKLGAKPIKDYVFADGKTPSASDFTIKASATRTGNQIHDTGCTQLKITKSGLMTPANC